MVLKTAAGLIHKFRCQSEIPLSRGQIDVPKKSSKLWKKALDVFSSAIPFENAVNCCRMAQIVQARLHPWTTWTVDAGTRTKTSKALFRASAC